MKGNRMAYFSLVMKVEISVAVDKIVGKDIPQYEKITNAVDINGNPVIAYTTKRYGKREIEIIHNNVHTPWEIVRQKWNALKTGISIVPEIHEYTDPNDCCYEIRFTGVFYRMDWLVEFMSVVEKFLNELLGTNDIKFK